MPTVPRLQRGAPTAPLPDVRQAIQAPAAAFGVPATVDLSGVQQVVQQAHDHAQQVRLDGAELQLSDLRTSLMAKATAAKGLNALDAATQARSEWQEKSDEIINSLPSDRLKDAARRHAAGFWQHLNQVTESHASAEAEKADTQTTAALLKNDLRDVDQSPELAPTYADIARQRVATFGQRYGWTPEFISEKQAAHVSDIHATAISRMVASGSVEDATAASAYLEKHRAELVGQQRDDAEHQVDAALAQGAGFREADAILKQTGNPVADDPEQEKQQPVTMTQALAKAEAIPDPRARKAATDAIVAHFSHLETAKRLEREAARSEVIRDVEAHGGAFNRASKAWLLIAGTPEGEQVMHRSEQLLKPAKDPGDPEGFLAALSLASVSPATRDKFLRMDFTGKDGAGMNTAQRSQLITKQSTLSGQSTRSSAADAVEAERIRFEREKALLNVGEPSSPHYIEDQAERNAELGRLKYHYDQLAKAHGVAPTVAPVAAPAGQTGAVTLGGRVPENERPHEVLTAAPAIQATPKMIADAAKNPAYAELLRSMGVLLPKKLPIPVEPSKQ
jgi:hypothetical protein